MRWSKRGKSWCEESSKFICHQLQKRPIFHIGRQSLADDIEQDLANWSIGELIKGFAWNSPKNIREPRFFQKTNIIFAFLWLQKHIHGMPLLIKRWDLKRKMQSYAVRSFSDSSTKLRLKFSHLEFSNKLLQYLNISVFTVPHRDAYHRNRKQIKQSVHEWVLMQVTIASELFAWI